MSTTRPVYLPIAQYPFYDSSNVSFEWFGGFTVSQKRKCIADLHESASRVLGVSKILDNSTKSPDEDGRALSPFNLRISLPFDPFMSTVESTFHGSSVFEHGGPLPHLLTLKSTRAKKDEQRQTLGPRVGFYFDGIHLGLEPHGWLFDFLMMRGFLENPWATQRLLEFEAFTDITCEKTPITNQARCAAIYVGMTTAGLEMDVSSPEAFLSWWPYGDQTLTR